MSTPFLFDAVARLREDQDRDLRMLEIIKHSPSTFTLRAEGSHNGRGCAADLLPDYFMNIVRDFLTMRTAARANKIARAEIVLREVGPVLSPHITASELHPAVAPDPHNAQA